MKIRVDTERCTGHAMCAAHAPDVYELNEIGHCAANGATVPAEMHDNARSGAMACPEQAIDLLDDPS